MYEKALDLIVEGREKHFDPAIVDAFLHVAPAFRLSPTAHISHV